MRLLLDTNVFVFMLQDPESLSRDVYAILEDYDNQKYLSMESVRELIVAYRSKGLFSNRWKSEREMVDYIFGSNLWVIDPIDAYVLRQMADLRINTAQKHNDPSDHRRNHRPHRPLPGTAGAMKRCFRFLGA